MNRIFTGWVLALCSALIWPSLLPLPIVVFIIPGLFLLRRYSLATGILLGLLWFHFHAHRLTTPERPLAPDRVVLQAEVVSLPVGGELYQRSTWRVETINQQNLALGWPNLVQLSWYNGPKLAMGHRYRLVVQLKEPNGVLNQGGSNRRRHLLASGISATGYVIGGERLTVEVHWRQSLADRLETWTQTLPRGDLIRALVLADRRGLDSNRWDQMRQAGLLHLIAISGLHLSIVAGLALVGGRWLLQRLKPDPLGATRPVVWTGSAVLVIGYALLAGMTLPTVRAAIMVVLGLLLLWQAREARPWEILLRAAALVLLVDPLAALSAGFWLSFGAVSVLLLLNWLKPPGKGFKAWFWHLACLQLGLTLCLVPIQALWFGHYSLHGLWANLLVLPYFTFVGLPLVLLGAGLASVFESLGLNPAFWIAMADLALVPVAFVASLAEQFTELWPFSSGTLTAELMIPILGMTAAIGLFVFKPWRHARVQAFVLLLPLATGMGTQWQQHRAGWWLHMVDVGQGLALVVEKDNKFLLYDTGASFRSGFSFARISVLPFLRYRGAKALDILVVSHGDNDHAGGVADVIGEFEVKQRIGIDGINCNQGPQQWQGLSLNWWQAQVNGRKMSGNNGSCILRLSDGNHSVLLSGDIESEAEQRMIVTGSAMPTKVLVSPHHGSKSSSSMVWLELLQPELVLVSTARGNRWGFPHPEVVERYQQLGAKTLISGEEGQISIYFDGSGDMDVRRYRKHMAPWWYNRQ